MIQQARQDPVEVQADPCLNQSGADSEIEQDARIGPGERFVHPHQARAQESGSLVGLPHFSEQGIPPQGAVAHHKLIFLVHGIVKKDQLQGGKNTPCHKQYKDAFPAF